MDDPRDRPQDDVAAFPPTDPRLAVRDAALARLAAELDAVATKSSRLERQAGRRDRELAMLTRRLEETRSQLMLCQQDRDALLSSTSWKITAPLRVLAGLARRPNGAGS